MRNISTPPHNYKHRPFHLLILRIGTSSQYPDMCIRERRVAELMYVAKIPVVYIMLYTVQPPPLNPLLPIVLIALVTSYVGER